MGTVNLKMKLSAILIAAVSASPVAHDKDSSVAKSGKPMSGKPDMKPMSGHHDYKDQDGHDMDHDMEEEWKEFQELMYRGKADNNIMNVNFAPINTTGLTLTPKLKLMSMSTLGARNPARNLVKAKKWKNGKKNSMKDMAKTNSTWK